LTGFYDALRDAIQGLDEEGIHTRVLDGGKLPRVVEVEFLIPADSVSVSSAGITEQKNDASLESLRRDETISRFEREWNVEVVFQRSSIHRRYKRLAIFDMDSTLIQQEVIDEIAALIGVEAEVSAITARAMNGELDFEASLRQRCALLKGVPGDLWDRLKSKITLNNGVKELIIVLKRLGFKTGVLSGGFTPLTGWLAGQLGLDYAFANHLVLSEDGQSLTGELVGEIVHAERKRQHVLDIAAKEGVLLDQVLVVGDGANDLPMMGVAGLGVAFNAKAKVQLQAPARLNRSSMLDVLFLLGISREEMNELLR
jgi:phosphoserine phosphatase